MSTHAQPAAYKAVMQYWDQRGSVRGPRIEIEGAGHLPFTPELFPVVAHEVVVKRGPETQRALLAQRLFGYMDFTYVLELDVIVPVASAIAAGKTCLGVESALIEDALCVVVDEGFHARTALRTKRAVANQLHIALPITPPIPGFMRALHSELSRTSPEERATVQLIFAVVSETLITSTLSTLPKDERVLPVIREAVSEHARDEGLHHHVFSQVLKLLWQRWSEAQRDRYAPYLARFMYEFLKPDFSAIRQWLHLVGLGRPEVGAVMEDTYPKSQLVKILNIGAQASLRVMANVGVLDHSRAADEFSARGLALAA